MKAEPVSAWCPVLCTHEYNTHIHTDMHIQSFWFLQIWSLSQSHGEGIQRSLFYSWALSVLCIHHCPDISAILSSHYSVVPNYCLYHVHTQMFGPPTLNQFSQLLGNGAETWSNSLLCEKILETLDRILSRQHSPGGNWNEWGWEQHLGYLGGTFCLLP